MKREIKFRGKSIDNGLWIYGSYHKHDRVKLCIASEEEVIKNKQHIIYRDSMADWNMDVPVMGAEVDSETVGEFTGLKDKNGKEIYEGDVCVIPDFYPSVYVEDGDYKEKYEDTTVVIKYADACFYFCDENEMPICAVDYKEIEIIGNIYENPELIK